MLWGCFAAGGTGALHKIDDILREGNYVDILKQHLKISVRKLKLRRKWVFQMDNDPKHTSKVVAKWLKDNNVSVFGVTITKPCPQSHRTFVGRTEKACACKEAYKPDPVTPALSGGMDQNEFNCLWKATQNV